MVGVLFEWSDLNRWGFIEKDMIAILYINVDV